MKDWESRLDRLFIKLRGLNVFSDKEIDVILKNHEANWDKDLVKRTYPVKYLDQLSKG
jgi:hypothetical protein